MATSLNTLFRPVTSSTQIAPLAGGLPPMNIDGSATATPSPDASNAPSLTLTGNPGVMGAMAQGANQASLTGMAANAIGLSPNGVFSGNVSPAGFASTAGHAGIGMVGGMVPGFGPANLTTGALGALAGLATLFGSQGQQTNSELSGPIGEGLGLAGTGPNVNANVANAITGRGDSAAPNSDPDGGGNGPAGPGSASGPGGSAGAPSGGGDSGNPGDFNKGGTVPGRGNRDTKTIHATPGEEVVRKSEASKPMVRAALKDINEPGEGRVERGLSQLFRKG